MTTIATDLALHITLKGGHLIGASVLPVARLPTRPTELIIPNRPVERCKLPELLPLVLIQHLIHRSEQLLHHTSCSIQRLLGLCLNKYVEVLVLARIWLEVPLLQQLALLDTALPTDDNLRTGLLLHPLLGVATGANNEADKVVAGVLLHGDVELLLELGRAVVGGGLEGWVAADELGDDLLPLAVEALPGSVLAGVDADAKVVVDGLRGGGARALGAVVERKARLQQARDLEEARVEGVHLGVHLGGEVLHEVRERDGRARLLLSPPRLPLPSPGPALSAGVVGGGVVVGLLPAATAAAAAGRRVPGARAGPIAVVVGLGGGVARRIGGARALRVGLLGRRLARG